MNNLDETGPYIWLRYATQYSKDGQMHTIEMSVPVPLGASTERREELFREAEAGMNQLISRFGHRLPQTPQRVQDLQAEYNAASRSDPVQKSISSQQPRNKPASVRNQEPVVPPTRPNVGASMPMALGPNLDSSGNLPLPEFIQYIHENLNLTPRQAMEMLKVKSLSTGINLREALERLRNLVAQRNANPVAQPEERVEGEIESERPPVGREAASSSAPASISTATENHVQQSSQTPDDQMLLEDGSQQDDHQSQIIEMRVSAPVRFDEEEDLEEEELGNLDLPPEITSEQLEYARSKISELRESQGATAASPKRLQALGNVVGDQLSQERLQELVFGIWGVSVLKKLKMDQVEALISWAKQDDFVDEVEAALAVLEEDRYARGNR